MIKVVSVDTMRTSDSRTISKGIMDIELKDEDYPNAVEATKRCLSLPMHPYMMEEDIEYICSVILKEIK